MSSDLDSDDRLRAFRLAMGFGLPQSRYEDLERSEGSQTFSAVNEARRTRENWEDVEDWEIMSNLPSPSIQSQGTDNADLSRDAQVLDHDSPQVLPHLRNVHPRPAKTPHAIEETLNPHETSSSAKDAVGTLSSSIIPTTADDKPISNSQQPWTPAHKRKTESSAVERISNSPHTDPQPSKTSPANILVTPKSGDDLSVDEAHDCVIDIAKELAALSERIQARKIAASKNYTSPLLSQQSSPTTVTSSITSEMQATSQPDLLIEEVFAASSERTQARKIAASKNRTSPSISQQSSLPIVTDPVTSEMQATSQLDLATKEELHLALPPVTQSRLVSPEKPDFKKAFVLPHLRKAEQHDNSASKEQVAQEDKLLPHLRGLGQDSKTLPATNIRNSHTTSMHSRQSSKPSHDSELPIRMGDVSLDPLSQEPSGDQVPSKSLASSEPVSQSGMVTGDEQKPKDLQVASTNTPSQRGVTATAHENEGKNTEQAFLPSSKPNDLDQPSSGKEKYHLKDNTTSSFLDKWGSKASTRSPKFKAPTTTGSNTEPGENLEEQLIFKSWPGQTARSRPTAQVRTCHLTNLPPTTTPATICSVIFGGALERVQVRHHHDVSNDNNIPGPTTATATVRFLSSSACKHFHDSTANGLLLKPAAAAPGGPRETVAWVTMGKEVDVIGGLLTQQLEQGATRCVRAVPVDASLTGLELTKMAVEKAGGGGGRRQLEGFEEGVTLSGRSRFVVWRFCDIADAISFRGVLARMEEFESCNVQFSDDPCALRVAPDM